MAPSGDDQWRELNRELEGAMAINDFQRMSQLYFEMALQTYREGRGFAHLLEQRAKAELMHWKRSGDVTQVSVQTADDSCPQCKKLNGARFEIDDALHNMPLPQVDCSHELQTGKPGWCRCLYLPVIKDMPEVAADQPEAKKQGFFTPASAIVFIILLFICGCALCYYVPQLTR